MGGKAKVAEMVEKLGASIGGISTSIQVDQAGMSLVPHSTCFFCEQCIKHSIVSYERYVKSIEGMCNRVNGKLGWNVPACGGVAGERLGLRVHEPFTCGLSYYIWMVSTASLLRTPQLSIVVGKDEERTDFAMTALVGMDLGMVGGSCSNGTTKEGEKKKRKRAALALVLKGDGEKRKAVDKQGDKGSKKTKRVEESAAGMGILMAAEKVGSRAEGKGERKKKSAVESAAGMGILMAAEKVGDKGSKKKGAAGMGILMAAEKVGSRAEGKGERKKKGLIVGGGLTDIPTSMLASTGGCNEDVGGGYTEKDACVQVWGSMGGIKAWGMYQPRDAGVSIKKESRIMMMDM